MRRTALALSAAALTAIIALTSSCSFAPPDATDVVSKIVTEVPGTSRGVVFTAADDPAQLLGRPGGYVSAATIVDSQATGSPVGDPGSLDAGARVEVFASEEDAVARVRFTDELARMVPVIAAHYSFRLDDVVVRVTRSVPRERALQYKEAMKNST